MGLFKKSKKKNNESVNTVANVNEEKPSRQVASDTVTEQDNPLLKAVANDGRRFTMLAEKVILLEGGQGIQVTGVIYGNLQLDDLVYFILPNNMIMYSRVDGIEIGEGQSAGKAENQGVVLFFKDIKDVNCVPKYTVLTSIHPQDRTEEQATVENPHLLGLSRDFHRLSGDSEYFNIFIYVLCHAYFLVPVKTPEGGGKEMEGQVQFPSLKDPKNPNKTLFPVFTDWLTLVGWQALFEEGKPPKAVVLRFPEAVNICKGSGMILNPFGPTAIMISDKLIEQIVNVEGYKKEFCSGE